MKKEEASKNGEDSEKDKEWMKEVKKLTEEITAHLDKYQFNYAAAHLYEFIWHQFADVYIEDVKNRIDDKSYSMLVSQFLILLKLLHPFMPFITEEIYARLYGGTGNLIISQWPK